VFDAIEDIWDSKGGVGPEGGDKCARVFSVRHSGVLCVTQASQADTYQSGPLQGFPTDSLASMSQVEAILFPCSPLPLWATSAGRPGATPVEILGQPVEVPRELRMRPVALAAPFISFPSPFPQPHYGWN